MRLLGACGLAAAGIALWREGTALGGLSWVAAVVIACIGFGGMYARALRQEASMPLLAIVGLALLVSLSTVAAKIGLLPYLAQLGTVVVGAVSILVVPPRQEPRAWSRATVLVFACSALLLVVVALALDVTVLGDGDNHTFAVKRLWDTGRVAIYHSLGAGIVGESYFALGGGAQCLHVFDGVTIALLIWLLAYELAGRERDRGLLLFVVLAVPLVLQPLASRDWFGVWPIVLVAVAATSALQRAIDARQTGWLVIPMAACLLVLRHELVPAALPLAAAAVVAPVRERASTRTLVVLASVWSLILIAMQLGYRSSVPLALLRVGGMWLALPLTVTIIRLLGLASWRSGTGLLAFVVVSQTIASASRAVSLSFQAPHVLPAVWLALAFAVVLALDMVRPATSALAIALLVGVLVIDPNTSDVERDRLHLRLVTPAATYAELRDLGFAIEAHQEVRAVQEAVPPRARIAFWGRSAAMLDFRRNPIRDVSWPAGRWRTDFYLSSIQPRSLRAGDFLIVETMLGRPEPDAWGTLFRPKPLTGVANRLEPLVEAGRVSLFRVRD